MAKRKQPERAEEQPQTPSKRQRKPSVKVSESRQVVGPVSASKAEPAHSRAGADTDSSPRKKAASPSESSTAVPNGKTLFTTPTRPSVSRRNPSKTKNADHSAKRKSARRLAEIEDKDDWDSESALAKEILEVDAGDEDIQPTQELEGTTEAEATTPSATPSKRGRGRPKGAKNKREPTPEGDIAPEERYFFQNRAGPPQYSTNLFNQVKLLTHDEYFEQLRRHQESHEDEKKYLAKLRARSFPQWKFELSQGYNICLYGYGSKRQLTNAFMRWLHARSTVTPRIVVINGYTSKMSVRNIITTIGSALVGEDEELKLPGQVQDMLDALLSHLSNHPPPGQLLLVVNSIDSQTLRKAATQAILARLAAHPLINLIATTDTPTASLLWSSSLLDQFNFAFHDCTTFEPYTVELSVVDDIYDLLGRKGRRIGGKDGIGFVLKSLPPNARNLYRILLAEILAVLSDDNTDFPPQQDDDADTSRPKQNTDSAEEIGIEYRILYQKASEEFICSSDMNFRFLLKEFHDHQMITTRRDARGTELLCVPLGREEMQAVLEELVVA